MACFFIFCTYNTTVLVAKNYLHPNKSHNIVVEMPQSSKAIGWSHRVLPRYYGIFLIVILMDKQKSFVMYYDMLWQLLKLTDEEAGRLLKAIYIYKTSGEIVEMDRLLDLIFEPIRNTLDRDMEKWEKYIEKQQENGKKWGRPKKENENPSLTQKTQAFSQKPKKADSVSVNVNVNDSESDSEINTNSKELVISNDKRDKSIDNIIDTIKKALKDNWLVYTSWKQERNRAKNISQNKELKEIADESGRSVEETIYAIVQLSHQSQYAKKINNAVDFYYKWAEVYNYLKNLKQEKIDKQNNFISDMVF